MLLVLLVPGCGSGPRVAGSVGVPSSLECAPFARRQTGIALYGDAAAWWDQAAGRYARGPDPVPGGVLVFRRSARLPHGHVSVVTGVVGPREIRVAQANWVRGRVTRDEPVVDVSARGDWSAVRVWWAPGGALGAAAYPTHGFIAPPGQGGAVAGAPGPKRATHTERTRAEGQPPRV